jgi:hypothetical protein
MATSDKSRQQAPREQQPRFGASALQQALDFGPLASLRGSWKGTGFSVMWRPNNHFDQPPPPPEPIKRYLQLNLTSETLDFHAIPGQIPNRGLDPQEDIILYGLHYLQRVSDNDAPGFLNAGEALHLEPGLFMLVPANDNSGSTKLPEQETVVRMGSIPHGVTVVMQGAAPSATPVAGGPTIPPIYPIAALPTFTPQPPPGGTDVVGLGIQPAATPPSEQPGTNLEHVVPEVRTANDVPGGPIQTQSNGPFPGDFQEYVDDPNLLLREANAGLDILGTITIQLSTDPIEDAISQIPFLGLPSSDIPLSTTNNCFVQSASATFWLEWVKADGQPQHHPKAAWDGLDGHLLNQGTYLQLQYSQTVILVFNKVLWPHITVATLRLSNG